MLWGYPPHLKGGGGLPPFCALAMIKDTSYGGSLDHAKTEDDVHKFIRVFQINLGTIAEYV